MSNSTEITKVQVIIRRFLWETRDVVNDSESSRRWLENFRNTLQFQDLNDNPEPYALALLSEARKFNEQQLRKQQTRWVRESLKKDGITNPTKEQIETRWAELYGNETTADGDIREDSQDRKSGTSANNYTADAPTREDGEFKSGSGNAGNLKSATSANNSEARESQRRAGADSVRGNPSHSAPARSSGAMPDDVQLVYDFAAAENLDPVDAYECWNVTVNERDGKTADGKRITNWKAYVRKWCVTRASNRRTA